MKTRTIFTGLMLLPLFCAVAVPARAQTSDADFQQAVAAYQQLPSDATAEKVVRMAAAMDQLPPIPEEARRHFVRGTALFKDAKSSDDYKQVVDEFAQAVHLAPWWPEARYNLALAQEAVGDYNSAVSNAKLYLLFKLSEADARTAQDKIYALEAEQEKAARQPSPAVVAAQQQQDRYANWLKGLDGARFVYSVNQIEGGEQHVVKFVIEIRGNQAIRSVIDNGNVMGTGSIFDIQGTMFTEHCRPEEVRLGCRDATNTISESGASITRFNPTYNVTDVYTRQ